MRRPKIIKSIDDWNILKKALYEKGYRRWQWQHNWNDTEGFHAWFWKQNREDVEVITFLKAVQDAIIDYENPK